jgi:hypothetical protein
VTAGPAFAGNPQAPASSSADLSLAGEWLSATNGSVYDFTQTGSGSYNGAVQAFPPAISPDQQKILDHLKNGPDPRH